MARRVCGGRFRKARHTIKGMRITAALQDRSYKSLDAWRGFAALWVVVYHVGNVLALHDAARRNVLLRPLDAFSAKGWLGVEIFFVISGYCIISAAESARPRPGGTAHFFKARLRRIYPPLWAATAMSLGLLLAATLFARLRHLSVPYLNDWNIFSRSWVFYLSNFTLANAVTHQPYLIKQAWTLCYEVAFYGVVGTLLWAARRLPRFSFVRAVQILSILSLAALIVVPARVPYPWNLFPLFGLGAAVYDCLHGERAPAVAFAAALGVLVLIYGATTLRGSSQGDGALALSFFFSLGVAATLLAARALDEQLLRLAPVKFLAFVGIFSYSLYLVHGIVIFTLHMTLGAARPPILAAYLLAVGAALAAGRIFYQFFERPFVSAHRRHITQEVREEIAGEIPTPAAVTS